MDRPLRRQRASQEGSLHTIQAQGEQRIAVPNSIGAAALAGPVGLYEASAVAGSLAASVGLPALNPLESNSSAQHLMRYAEEGATGQKISMSRLQALMAASSGSPLPEAVRARLEQALGHDFSGVRIHTGGAAAQAAEGISAHAFTVGRDIFFNAGEFDPTSASGLELLAHELTHVIQHDEGRLPTPSGKESGISDPSDRSEVEAVQTARDALPALTSPSPSATPEAELAAGSAGALTEAGPASTAPAPTEAASAAPAPSSPILRRARVPGPSSNEEVPVLDEEQAEEGELTEEQLRQIEELERAREQADPPQEEEEEQEVIQEVPQEQQEEAPEEDGGQALPTVQEEGPSIGAPSPGGGGAAAQSDTAPGASGSLPALDEVVDYYMETHWDSSEYYAKLDELHIHLQVGDLVDRLTPPQASQGVRSAIRLAYSIHTGIIDAMAIGALKAIPGIGSIFHITSFIQDVIQTVDTYGDDDSFGLWLNIIRNCADVVGSVVGNIGDLATYAQDVAAVFSWTGVGAAIAGAVANVGTYADGIGATCDTIKAFCSAFSLWNNVMRANEAEANGEFRKAAKLRELAHGEAITVVADVLSLVGTVVSGATANFAPGEMVEDGVEMVAKVTKASKKSVQEWMQGGALNTLIAKDKKGALDGFGTAGKLLGVSQGKGLLTLTQGYDNLMYRIGLGDAMRLSPDGLFGGNYIDPSQVSGVGRAARELAGARQASIEHFSQVAQDLHGAPEPKFTQKIINDTLNPADDGGVMDALLKLSLTGVGEALVQHMFSFIAVGTNLLGGGAAGAFEFLAGTLENVAGPAVDALQDVLDTYKPALDKMLVDLTDALVEQQNVVQYLRDGLSAADAFLAQVATFTDAGGEIEQFLASATDQLSGLEQTKESLDIPNWVPEVAYRWALEAWNMAVKVAVRGLQGAAAEVLPQVDAFVDAQTARAQAYIDRMQDAIQEGGEVEAIIQGAYDRFAQTASSLAQSFADWNPNLQVDIPAAVVWLRERATATRDLTFDNRWEEFQQFMRGEAQAQVDAWKAEHGGKVEAMYLAEIPQAEVQAVQRVYELIDAKIEERSKESPHWGVRHGARHSYKAFVAYIQAMQVAQSGRTGEPTLSEFWSYADELAEIGSAVGA